MTIIKGDTTKPAILFVHGLGMSENFWLAPDKEVIFGGLVSLRVLLSGYKEFKTSWDDLSGRGYTVATWSQARPVGPADSAAVEMQSVLREIEALGHKSVIVIGHSRGGLIALRALSTHDSGLRVRGLIALCTPFGGSELARWATFFASTASWLRQRMPDGSPISIDIMLGFIESQGARELLPDSEFLLSLDLNPAFINSGYSMGGTLPGFVSIPSYDSLPQKLKTLIGKAGFPPDELVRDLGDGLVSEASARMPHGLEHLTLPVTHAGVVVDPTARASTLGWVDKLSEG